jgi:hypothetical protein
VRELLQLRLRLLLLLLLLVPSTNQTHAGGPHARSALPSAFPSLKNSQTDLFRVLVLYADP